MINPVFDLLLTIFMAIVVLISLCGLVLIVVIALDMLKRDPDMEIHNDQYNEHAQDHDEAMRP